MKIRFIPGRLKLLAGCLALAFFGAASRAAGPITVVIQPGSDAGKDVRITRGGTDTESVALFNFGATDCLKAGQSGADGQYERFLLRFELGLIPSNAIVEAAVLKLHGLGGPAVPVEGYRLKTDWDEGGGNEEVGTANWQQRTPALNWSGSDFRSADSGAFNAADAEIDSPILAGTLDGAGTNLLNLSTQKVQEWINGSFANFGLLVRCPSETNGGLAASVASSEHANAAWRPELRVTYRLPSTTPVPPTIASVAPNSGRIGSPVIITGANFGPTPADNVVYFGAVRAAVTVAATNALTVTVPVGATYAPITVTVCALTAYARAPFAVTFPGCHRINADSLEPKFDLGTPGRPADVEAADLDDDGRLDLVSVDYAGNTVSIYRNLGTNGTPGAGSFAVPVSLPTGNGPYSAACSDLDGDGKLDLAVVNVFPGTVSVYRNISGGGGISFETRRDFPAGTTPVYLAVGDLDGDGKPDLVVGDQAGDSIFVLRNTSTNGALSFADKAGFPTGSHPRGVAIGDLDRDGKPDVAVCNFFEDTVSLFGNTSSNGSVSFAAKVNFPAGPNPNSVVLGDVDGDGQPDLAVVNNHDDSGGSVSVFRNTSAPGHFSLQPKADFTAGFGPQYLALGDLDGDGKPDLVVGGGRGGGLYVLHNASAAGSVTTASFSAPIQFRITTAYAVAMADLDGDARADVAASSFEHDQISIFRSAVCLTDELPCPPRIVLSLATAGGGSVRADPWREQYSCREAVNVTATPAPLWSFLEWRGDATGRDTNLLLTMNRTKYVQGVFGTAVPTAVIGDGIVQTDPSAGLYPFGLEVRLAAVPAAGRYFAHWTNGVTGAGNPLTFTVESAGVTPTAVFLPLPENHFSLTVRAAGQGRVTANPPGHSFANAASVTFTATPEVGQEFLHWSGDASGTATNLMVTMNQSRTITAHFSRKPRLVVARPAGPINEAGVIIFLTGEFGQRYVIETSPNLAPPWTPLTTNMATYGAAQFTDPPTNMATQRFYRAVSAP